MLRADLETARPNKKQLLPDCERDQAGRRRPQSREHFVIYRPVLHDVQAVAPQSRAPGGRGEVTEAGDTGGGAEAPGDSEPLPGHTREERAEGAAQLPAESQGVHLPAAAQGEDVSAGGAAELRVQSHRSR